MTNHWVVGRSPCRGHASNGTDGCFKVLTWNHNGIKGKQFLPREKVAATRWLITRAGPDAKKGIHTKWWEKDMENNMKNIKSQEDFDEQLLKAGDKLTLAHFFSPNCRACKALHSKVHQFARMHPGLQFVMINYNEQTEICKRLNVHVLPLFRFYRGAEGQICSFSCTISTIYKLLLNGMVFRLSLAAQKGLEPWRNLNTRALPHILMFQMQVMLHQTWIQMTDLLDLTMNKSICCGLPSWVVFMHVYRS
ncbi:hypothetical protein PVAP13_9NG721300 [Panicum virgatum]|uniref:Thioredoxin domain-containing protein n=1 Tax=Panicum virgatum TaxID=38727 RepID=A0A8T0N243_PANVG|nr:hypothetical protein PVAP13_9NG721300 [Panicum virgatum]KAG2543165.1 hypothetical protein PVAP13_9NG721300 [Panicum virgatum]